MKLPLEITVRDNLELTEKIESEIREKAQKLNRYFDNITRCRVIVEAPHRHQRKGILYNIRIHIRVPGGELMVKREPQEDIQLAISKAFDAAQGQLTEYARQLRGNVKRHETEEVP